MSECDDGESSTEKIPLETIKKLYYDNSNGFGDIALKRAHDKLVEAVAAMMQLGGVQAEMAEDDSGEYHEHLEELMLLSIRNFTHNRDGEKFLAACQKLGIIEDVEELVEDGKLTEEGHDFCDGVYMHCAQALALDYIYAAERKRDEAGKSVPLPF